MQARPRCPFRSLVAAALAVAAAVLATPVGAAAQTRTCTLVEGGTMNQFTSAGLGVIQQFGGPVTFRCGGAVLIRSRRATVLQSRSEVRLEGDVLYRDSVQELRTDWLQRRARDGFMLARGAVVMRDLESGSEIRGQTMERRDRAGTPTETVVTGRPHATLYRQRSDEAPADALGTPASGAPIEVDADSLILLGSNVFRARGNAVFERGADLRGSGDALEFNDATGSLTVDGNARIDGERFDLTGSRVDALTVEGVIREVAAFGDAVLEGESMYLEAPEVYLFFERELLQSLEARGRAPRVTPAPTPAEIAELAAGGPDAGDPAADSTGAAARAALVDAPAGAAARAEAADVGARGGRAGAARPRDPIVPARAAAGEPELAGAPVTPADPAGDAGAPPLVFARAEGLEIRADSLHVVSPDERIETLTAVGMAHGVRLADSLAAAALPEGFADEWVRGDTVVARFVAPEGDAAADEGQAVDNGEGAPAGQDASAASGEQILERLEAVGHGVPASALSHTAEDQPGEYTLNYLLARRILMLVRGGEAREVQAEGTLRGVYLTPDGTLREASDGAADEGEDAATDGTDAPSGSDEASAPGGTGRAP
jgi:hypothetical protein